MKRENYNFKDTVFAFLFAVIGFIALNMMLMFIVSPILAGSGVELKDATFLTYLLSFLIEMVFLGVFFTVSGTRKVDFLSAGKMKPTFNWKVLLIVIAISFIAFFCSINSTALVNLGLSKISTLPLNSGNVPMNNFGQFILSVIVFSIVPAFCEEFLFRGLIYNGCKSKMSATSSIFLTAFLFTLIHFSIYQTVHQFILGIILGFLIYFTNSVYYGVLFHFINNFTVLFLVYVGWDKGLIFANFGGLEIFLSLLIFALGALCVVGLLFLLRKVTNEQRQKVEVAPDNKKNEKDKLETIQYVDDMRFNNIYLILSIALALSIWFVNSFGGGA